MRCSKCGNPNVPGATNCAKCGAPLEVSSFVPGTGVDPEVVPGTVLEPGRNQGTFCPKCGYPLRPGTTRCPRCQADINAPQPETNKPTGTPVKGTVTPWSPLSGPKKFKLEPIDENNVVQSSQALEFDGETVELNRGNVDANNKTITSKVQAVIKFDKDGWTIEDKSDLKTTFVQVDKPFGLRDGDRILLGNRPFVFRESK